MVLVDRRIQDFFGFGLDFWFHQFVGCHTYIPGTSMYANFIPYETTKVLMISSQTWFFAATNMFAQSESVSRMSKKLVGREKNTVWSGKTLFSRVRTPFFKNSDKYESVAKHSQPTLIELGCTWNELTFSLKKQTMQHLWMMQVYIDRFCGIFWWDITRYISD